ncbi:MAG: S-adenosylmethionine:tRNA ribosyltransferase-isomerase, partial [Chitinophagaceae bacterium]
MSENIDPRSLLIADYSYQLPEEKIARYPLPERDAAKLLVYDEGSIETRQFKDLPGLLPSGSLLVLNNAKVVHARLLFKKETGGLVEIFCLEPASRYSDMTIAMAQKGEVYWQCLVGGAAKWKDGQVLKMEQGDGSILSATMEARNSDDFCIHFSWLNPDFSFAEILDIFGKVPLPPYMNRASEEVDESSYQTVFAVNEGSVAAPTASLHFTSDVLENLRESGVEIARLTLHVGAGTFKPVKAETAGGHNMHSEWIEVSEQALLQLLQQGERPIIAAGTTALRTLESIYWFGQKIFNANGEVVDVFTLGQWDAYSVPENELCTRKEALEA